MWLPDQALDRRVSRRGFLGAGARQAALALAAGTVLRAAVPAGLEAIQVAYAGSMGAVMEGPVAAAARRRGWRMLGRAQGSTALARLIAQGSIHPDVFVGITASPMEIVLQARPAARALPVASTAMAISYAPRGRFAHALATEPWWQVMQRPGFRFGRSDPRADPQGRNIIYVCELAERLYHQPGLAARLLGPALNPEQIFAEATLEARLQAGQLDAAAAYAFQPPRLQLAAVPLPAAINLSRLDAAAQALALDLEGHRYHPEALLFYAAALQAGPHSAAAEFVDWLRSPPLQTILRQWGYGALATDAAPLPVVPRG